MRARSHAVSGALIAAVVAAGCLGGPAHDDHEDEDADGVTAPPVWRIGDWWTYTWESEIYQRSFHATVVVGAIENGTYFLGMPQADYELEALLFHLPAVGPIGMDLSYGVHEVPFDPLRFPLADGATWETTYISSPVTFVAHATDQSVGNRTDPVFHITNEATKEASGRTYSAVYDPSVGWFTSFERIELDGRLRERITLEDHGRGYEGDVRLIGPVEILYLDARTGGLLDPAGNPAAPTDTFDPDDGLDQIFIGCIYGDAPGAYRVTVETPTGTACDTTGTVPADNTTRHILVTELPNVPGEWTVRLVAVGQGLAIAEIMGYRSWTVTLPDVA